MRGKTLGPVAAKGQPLELRIRPACPDDAGDIARLAACDGVRVPPDPLLVAEVSGEIWAAASTATFELVTDRTRPSAELGFILLERARRG